jgi:hypothetical protein
MPLRCIQATLTSALIWSILLKISTRGDLMATVNFSVPDDVKAAFNRTFAKQNKSAIIAELMGKAVEEAKRQKQREEAFRILTARRNKRPSVTDEEIRAAREEGRP